MIEWLDIPSNIEKIKELAKLGQKHNLCIYGLLCFISTGMALVFYFFSSEIDPVITSITSRVPVPVLYFCGISYFCFFARIFSKKSGGNSSLETPCPPVSNTLNTAKGQDMMLQTLLNLPDEQIFRLSEIEKAQSKKNGHCYFEYDDISRILERNECIKIDRNKMRIYGTNTRQYYCSLSDETANCMARYNDELKDKWRFISAPSYV